MFNFSDSEMEDKGPSPYVIVCTSFYFCLILVILQGNCYTLWVFARDRRVRTNTNIFLASLAAADVLYGFGMTFWITQFFPSSLRRNKAYCLLVRVFAHPVELTSMQHVLAVCLERIVSLIWPLHHSKCFSRSNVLCMVSLLWLVTLTWGMIPTLGWNTWHLHPVCWRSHVPFIYIHITGFLRIGIILSLLLANLVLLMTLLKVARRLQREADVIEAIRRRAGARDPADQAFRNRCDQRRVARFVLTLVSLFLACHLPKTVFLIVESHVVSQRSLRVEEAGLFVNFGSLVNAAINPWLYFFRDPTFKAACRQRWLHVPDARVTPAL